MTLEIALHMGNVGSNETIGMIAMKKIVLAKILLILPLWLVCVESGYSSDRSVPVMIKGDGIFDACGEVHEVHGLKPNRDNFLAVRSGPGTQYTILGKLNNGDRLWICEDPEGNWLGVVEKLESTECNVTMKENGARPYDGPCMSGWVHRSFTQLIAG